MDTGTAVGSLFFVTAGIALAVAVFLYFRTRRSQLKRGETPGEVKVGEGHG